MWRTVLSLSIRPCYELKNVQQMPEAFFTLFRKIMDKHEKSFGNTVFWFWWIQGQLLLIRGRLLEEPAASIEEINLALEVDQPYSYYSDGFSFKLWLFLVSSAQFHLKKTSNRILQTSHVEGWYGDWWSEKVSSDWAGEWVHLKVQGQSHNITRDQAFVWSVLAWQYI